MYRFFLLILISIVSIQVVQAAEPLVRNAGFVPANIWYSKDPFYAGDKIRVYTMVFNGSAYDLTGTVEFLDNSSVIGKTSFSLSNGGRAQDLWVDWKATEGSHAITARIVNAVADGPDGKFPVEVPNIEAVASKRTVEIDPAIKEAQKKAEIQNMVATKNDMLGKVEELAQSVQSAVPEPLKATFVTGVEAVENFRSTTGGQLRTAKEDKLKVIESLSSATTPTKIGSSSAKETVSDSSLNVAEKPFAYVMVAVLALLQFVFEWKILFYGLILYAVYRIIRLIVERIRNR